MRTVWVHIPDYRERYVLLTFANEEAEGRKITVGEWLEVMNRHLAEQLCSNS